MKQLIDLVLVIVCGVLAVKFYTGRLSPPVRKAGWKTIRPEEAKARLTSGDPVVLLDVRTRAEYGEGHIPNAVCLPNEEIQPDMPAPFGQNAEILLYCRSGRRSAQAAEKLAAMGYGNVSDFGGIQDWPYEITTE